MRNRRDHSRPSEVDQGGATNRKDGTVRRIRPVRKAVIGFGALALVAAASLGGAMSATAAKHAKHDAGNVVFLSNQLAQVSGVQQKFSLAGSELCQLVCVAHRKRVAFLGEHLNQRLDCGALAALR